MDRDLLAHLPVIVAVASHRGFAAAAATLGMSPSAVSHAVRAVEDRLGQPIFARTTRSVSVTEAGERFLAAAAPALEGLREAFETMSAARGDIVGVLRINAPRVAFAMALTPILAELARAHPKLTVEVAADDALVDIVAQSFDAGVRIGAAIAADMTAVRLTPPFRTVIVAAPAYVEEHGAPESIEDLARHNCVGFRLLRSGALYDWELAQNGRDVAVATRGTAVVSDASVARELAIAGVGVAYVFEPLARADIAAGRLIAVMPEAAIEEDGLFLYYPRRASMAPKLRAFIDAARRIRAGAA